MAEQDDMFPKKLTDEERLIPEHGRMVYAPTFERWYRTYPRHVGKGAAWKAWQKAVDSMTKEEEEQFTLEAINATKAQVDWRSSYNGSKALPDWKHPSTWLNQACWLDELESIASPRPQRELRICDVEGCGREAIGYDYGLDRQCAYHYSMTIETPSKRIFRGEDLRQYMRDNPQLRRRDGESQEEYTGRLRQFFKNRAKHIGGL